MSCGEPLTLEELIRQGWRPPAPAQYQTTNPLYAEIDRLRAENNLLKRGIYCKEKVEKLEARVIELQNALADNDEQYNSLKQHWVGVCKGLTEKNAEWELSFQLFDDAIRRGDAMHRKDHPESKLSLPSTDKLVLWLLERLETYDHEITDWYHRGIKWEKHFLELKAENAVLLASNRDLLERILREGKT
jgi:hypothetical protein